MTLVDTSVWVHHLRQGVPRLGDLLSSGEVIAHPYVIGELACGAMVHREEILDLLSALPSAIVATHEEALHLVERHRLQGRGLGWIDIHLLASALMGGLAFWTQDRKLHAAARALGIAERH